MVINAKVKLKIGELFLVQPLSSVGQSVWLRKTPLSLGSIGRIDVHSFGVQLP